jgi:hypothetical protein
MPRVELERRLDRYWRPYHQALAALLERKRARFGHAVLLCAPPSSWRTLQNKQWQELFVTQRDGWHEAQLVLFGHALLEKLLQPYKGITAHVLCVSMPKLATDKEVDAWLCQQLTPEFLETKPFLPMPIAGIPGWWPGNETPDFFEDKKVFRD